MDDLRPDLGCYGAAGIHTPNIDRLARRGMRFDHDYCQYPVCNPSRSSLLSGLRPDTLGIVMNLHADNIRTRKPDAVTLPQLFREHGHYTASLGKVIHCGVDAGETLWTFKILNCGLIAVTAGRQRPRG